MKTRLFMVTFVLILPSLLLAESLPPPPDEFGPRPPPPVHEVSAGGNWCYYVNLLDGGGGEVLLLGGEYDGACQITASGTPGSPIVIRHKYPENIEKPARIVYDGTSSNVVDVEGSHITFQALEFESTQPNIDAIKIKSGGYITINGCTFTGIGGISIAANSTDTKWLKIRDNKFQDVNATAIYLGCQDGMGDCVSSNLLVADNLIDGVDSESVGYGVQIKLDSFGTIRDNVITGTKGPGIEVYGSIDSQRVTVIDGNFVVGSKNNAALEVGGGPAKVYNNIVVGGTEGGIYVYDYDNRGLVRAIQVVGNTAISAAGPAIRIAGWEAGNDLTLSGNAAWQENEAKALPDTITGVPMVGNVLCADPSLCWEDAKNWNFSPVAGQMTTGWTSDDVTSPGLDFCGVVREPMPHAGALQLSESGGPEPLTIDHKAKFTCSPTPIEPEPEPELVGPPPEPIVERGLQPDGGSSPPPVVVESAGGCGCRVVGGSGPGLPIGSFLILLLGAGLWIRHRSRTGRKNT